MGDLVIVSFVCLSEFSYSFILVLGIELKNGFFTIISFCFVFDIVGFTLIVLKICLFYVYECIAYMCACVPCVCL